MHTRANARLTQKGRSRLLSQHLNDHRPLAELAVERRDFPCALPESGWPTAPLADRRSVRCIQQLTFNKQHLQRAKELRYQRLHLRHMARLLAAPFSTVARALSRLRNLEPEPPVQRYEREPQGLPGPPKSLSW